MIPGIGQAPNLQVAVVPHRRELLAVATERQTRHADAVHAADHRPYPQSARRLPKSEPRRGSVFPFHRGQGQPEAQIGIVVEHTGGSRSQKARLRGACLVLGLLSLVIGVLRLFVGDALLFELRMRFAPSRSSLASSRFSLAPSRPSLCSFANFAFRSAWIA